MLFVISFCCLFISTGGLSARLNKVSLRVPSVQDAKETVTRYKKLFPPIVSRESTSAMDLVFDSEFAIELSWSENIKPYDAEKTGLLEIGIQVNDKNVLGENLEFQQKKLCASLVPDEDPSKQTNIQMVTLDDPSIGGIPLQVIETTEKSTRSKIEPKIVLCVSDLDASIDFYTNAIGMRLLRKRSLLPETPAMVAFLAFSPQDADELVHSPEGADGLATPRIELRYLYGNENISPDTGLGEIVINNCPDTAAHAATIDEWGGHATEIENGTYRFTDPDGYLFRLEPL